MKVVALAGGTGSAKLLRGLSAAVGQFTVVSNVGDNFWQYGLYICPDIDIAMYTLAGVADDEKGWGVQGDTFAMLGQMKRLGEDAWFNLGDKDLATHILRTELVSKGNRLGDITTTLCKRFGVAQRILPCTDDKLETYVTTPLGTMHLQEFWVKNRGTLEVQGVEFRGAEGARPSNHVLEAIENADRIIMCPANPVTSILPILAVEEVSRALESSKARRVAVSPVVAGSPFSGPAGKMMKAIGSEATAAAVARLYSGKIDALLIDAADAGSSREIAAAGVKPVPSSILMRGRSEEERLARAALES